MSSVNFCDLPDEIVTEIVLRLPLSSLSSLFRVSKGVLRITDSEGTCNDQPGCLWSSYLRVECWQARALSMFPESVKIDDDVSYKTLVRERMLSLLG